MKEDKNRLIFNYFLDFLSKYLILIVFIAATCYVGILISFNKNIYNNIIWIIKTLPIFFAAFICIQLINKYPFNLKNSLYLFDNIKRHFFLIIFSIIWILATLSIWANITRPAIYFIFIAILFSLIFMQIFSKNIKSNLILVELILLMVSIIYGQTLNYPLYFGFGDTLSHIFLANVTYLSGHIIPQDLDFTYSAFPLYHILVAQGSLLCDIDIRLVLFLFFCIPFTTVLLFIYKLGYFITKNNQLSLLTCLIYSFLPIVITYESYIITRVVAYIGFIILLYLIFKLNISQQKKFYILIFLICLFIILVHQVTITQILILLFILFLCEIMINKDRNLHFTLLIFITLLFIAYWFYGSFSFFGHMLESRFEMLTPDSVTMPTQFATEVKNPINLLFFNLDSLIFNFFILIGLFYIISTYKKQNYLATIGLFCLFTSIFYISNPFQLSWLAMVGFRADRLALLLAPFFSIIIAVGIVIFIYYMQKKGISKYISILLILILAFLSFSLSNAPDTTEFSWYQNNNFNQRPYFNFAELKSFSFIDQKIPFSSNLFSDTAVQIYYHYDKFSLSNYLEIPYYTLDNLIFEKVTDVKGYSIIRVEEFHGNGLKFYSPVAGYSSFFLPNTQNRQKEIEIVIQQNKIYSNNVVYILKQ